MRFTQLFTKPFSRLKNGLLENQPQWPIVVKDDALTVDTVLYHTNFGPDAPSERGLEDNEANTPGVRVEYLLHDGTKSGLSATTEGTCTLQIVNSGTYNAHAILTWPDSTTTRINLVTTSVEDGTGWIGTFGENDLNREANFGPYPVYMTLQEFCDTLDTFVKEGEVAASSRTLQQPTGWKWKADQSSANFATQVSNWGGASPEANFAVAATIFMPMVGNLNQLSAEIAGARNDTGNADGTAVQEAGQGQTRYDHQPSGTDSATIKYAVRGTSGDGLHCIRWGGAGSIREDSAVASNIGKNLFNTHKDLQANHGHASGPKWRMKTALAIFLKDGTYTISDGGAIIPYTYDPDRTFGGFKNAGEAQAVYTYGMWDGGADALAENSGTGTGTVASAQVMPGYFMQGPVSPTEIATNRVSQWGYEKDYYANLYQVWQGTSGSVTNNGNAVYNPAFASEMTTTRHYQQASAGYGASLPNPITKDTFSFERKTTGSDSFLHLRDPGGHGIQTEASSIWIFIHQAPDAYTNTSVRRLLTNAWFPVERVDDFEIKIKLNPFLVTNWTNYGGDDGGSAVPGTGSKVCVGHQWAFGTTLATDCMPDSGLPHAVGAFLPGYEVLGETGAYSSIFPSDYANKVGRFQRKPRFQGAQVDDGRAQSDNRDPAFDSPTQFQTGGGALRISTGRFGMGLFRGLTTDTEAATPMSIHWQGMSVESHLLSAVDAKTGKHAWAEVKPSFTGGHSAGETTWPMGRNRNWPAHIRAEGTAYGVAPNLHPGAENYSNHPESGIATEKFGLTELGSSPIFLDMEMSAFIPGFKDRMVKIWFEQDSYEVNRGKLSGYYSSPDTAIDSTNVVPPWFIKANFDAAFVGNIAGAWGHTATSTGTIASGSVVGMANPLGQTFDKGLFTASQPWLWYWGGSEIMGADPLMPIAASTAEGGAFGIATNGIGNGGVFSGSQGNHVWRVTFDNRGMQFLLDGESQGFDPGAASPVHSVRIQHAALNYENIDSATDQLRVNNDDVENDLQIDRLTYRQIPTLAMLPFVAETTVIEKNAGIYRSLVIVADGINKGDNANITVSICTPGTTTGVWNGYGRAPGTPLANFTSLDPFFVGGQGSISLVDLPEQELNNGFTIRFEYSIPHTATEKTIDWNDLPRITSWYLDFDLDPTASLAVVGETFQNDLTSPIDTKVGHILTFESTLATADPDRLISFVKYDFGDGVISEWIQLDTPSASATHSIVHSYASAASSLNAKVYAKDDNGNISDASTAIVVNIAGAEPVAVLRAIPSTVRTGQAVTLDGSASFDPDGTTLQNFRFTSGDGGSVIGPQSQNYAQHTFANAGEYKATMTVEDGTGNTSNTASAIIKVLPANLVMPLTLNTRPSSFSRNRRADFSRTPVLDSAFPELRDSGRRSDEFQLTGTFLKDTANEDIAYMEELLMLGALVEFEWQSVNYQGVADSKTFVGRMTDFSYKREGGERGQTPYQATFVRESGMGV